EDPQARRHSELQRAARRCSMREGMPPALRQGQGRLKVGAPGLSLLHGAWQMDLEARITFPGGKRVNAELDGRPIPTDQPASVGGEGTAPEPFVLFAASIGTCAGFYLLSFCQAR